MPAHARSSSMSTELSPSDSACTVVAPAVGSSNRDLACLDIWTRSMPCFTPIHGARVALTDERTPVVRVGILGLHGQLGVPQGVGAGFARENAAVEVHAPFLGLCI